MANYPYAKMPAKLANFFHKIQQDVSVPDKVSTKWLQSIGFTSSNDVSMIGVLQFIGFVDSAKVPTEDWQSYRDRDKAPRVLAQSIRRGYSELFDRYNDAQSRNNDELTNFFRSEGGLGSKATALMVKTFAELCSLSQFSETSTNGAQISQKGNARLVPQGETPVSESAEPAMPALHLDVQIHISADASPEQIDHIFESMAKHLYKSGKEQIA